MPLKDEQGRYIVNILFNQDYMAWVTQGPIAKREKEGVSGRTLGKHRWLLRLLGSEFGRRPVTEITPAELLLGPVRLAIQSSFWWLLFYIVLAAAGIVVQIVSNRKFEIEVYNRMADEGLA